MAANTLRDQVLPAINLARVLYDQFGFRQFRAEAVVVRTWSGGNVGEGTATDVVTSISPAYKARVASLREVAASGGTLREGDIKVSEITPAVCAMYGQIAQTLGGVGTGTITGLPNVLDAGVSQLAWRLVVKITTTGTTFQFSLDGGTTYNGTDISVATPYQVAAIGLQLTFAGAFVAADTYVVNGTSAGYTAAQIRPTTVATNVEILYRLTGPDGQFYCTLVRFDTDRNFHFTAYLRRTRLTP